MKFSVALLLVFGWLTAYSQEFSARYELVNLGKDINTPYHEAAPVISQDGKKLYFFVHNHPQNNYGTDGSDDIWYSTLQSDGSWGTPVHAGSPFNEHRSNQVFTSLPDGSLLIRGGRAKNSRGFCLVTPSGNVTELKIDGLDEMNKGRSYGASISSDGKQLIISMSEFAQSIRSSLYVSHLQTDGTWTRPKRLISISNKTDDFGPFIGPDNQWLYFSSDRNAPGKQGGADIYRTKRLDDTWEKWSEPVNMGPVINTNASDFYFCIDKNSDVFVSRANSTIDGGNLDLFVLVPRDIKVFLAGHVYDASTLQPMPNVEVDIIPNDNSPLATESDKDGQFKMQIPEVDQYTVNVSVPDYVAKSTIVQLPTIENDTTLMVDLPLTPIQKKLVLSGTVFDSKTNAPIPASLVLWKKEASSDTTLNATDGKYSTQITSPGWYILRAKADGHLDGTDSVQIDNLKLGQVQKDLVLKPLEVGLTVRLNNIYFDFDKTTLKSESFTELDKVVQFLNDHPSLEIEIAGHTDDKGSDDYNLNLSQGRAQAVVDYIVGQGIDSSRLEAHGYGETKPIASNDTDEGRAENRRVEFTILKM